MVLYNFEQIRNSKSLELADEITYCRHKQIEIQDGNECVGSCPNCKYGAIFEIDPIEKIGQCHNCFTEFKLC